MFNRIHVERGGEGKGDCIHVFLDIAGIRLGFMSVVIAHHQSDSIGSQCQRLRLTDVHLQSYE